MSNPDPGDILNNFCFQFMSMLSLLVEMTYDYKYKEYKWQQRITFQVQSVVRPQGAEGLAIMINNFWTPALPPGLMLSCIQYLSDFHELLITNELSGSCTVAH